MGVSLDGANVLTSSAGIEQKLTSMQWMLSPMKSVRQYLDLSLGSIFFCS